MLNEKRRDAALAGARDLTGRAHEIDEQTEVMVARALHWGATWREIADALGVSPQAAHKRYRWLRYDPGTSRAWTEPPLPM